MNTHTLALSRPASIPLADVLRGVATPETLPEDVGLRYIADDHDDAGSLDVHAEAVDLVTWCWREAGGVRMIHEPRDGDRFDVTAPTLDEALEAMAGLVG